MKTIPLDRMPDAPVILVSRTDALGDLILSTPVFRSLKKHFPHAKIVALCSDYAAPILEHNPSIDTIITVPRIGGSVKETVAAIKSAVGETIDLGVALYPSHFAAQVLSGCKIKYRIGSSHRWWGWRFNYRVGVSRKENAKSEAAYNLELLRSLGISESATKPEVFVTEPERESIRQVLSQNNISEPFVVLHPGSAGSALDWPLVSFAELAKSLNDAGRKVIVTGNEGERKLLEPYFKEIGATLLAGRTSLRDLGALLSLAEVVVSNSTGPLHLAAAVGTPTVALFPPSIRLAPIRWAPPVDNCRVLTPNLPQCQCGSSGCRLGDCMASISVQEVHGAVVSAMGSAKSRC